MKTSVAALFCAIVLGTTALPAMAVVTPFDLEGRGGVGLLGGNEFPDAVVGGGSGGETGAGISFDDVTNMLTINIGWGSGNGFTDLVSEAFAGHIHGPTASAAPDSFLENASPLFTLSTMPGWNFSATNGGFSGSIELTGPQATDLFAGRFYVNAHTEFSLGGEIRGNLLPVPEPASFAMLGVGLALVAGIARRRRT